MYETTFLVLIYLYQDRLTRTSFTPLVKLMSKFPRLNMLWRILSKLDAVPNR